MGRWLAACAVVGLLGGVGCSSGMKVARLYTSGSDALDRGDLAQGIADLEAAAALDPKRSEVLNHLGVAYAAVGRDQDALKAFEDAVALDCVNDPAQINLEATRQRIALRAAAQAGKPAAAGSTAPATGSTPPATGSTPPATGSTPPATSSTPPAPAPTTGSQLDRNPATP